MYNLSPFIIQCQKILPLIYDDSISYYEVLCKVVDYLNKTMNNVTELSDSFTVLKNFVDTYFDNLNVQEEINNKLDEMAETGELQTILSGKYVLRRYNNVSDMKADDSLIDTQCVATMGYYAPGDGGGALYMVSSEPNGVYEETINGKFAQIINSNINILQCGANNETDCGAIINNILKFRKNAYVPTGNYIVNTNIMMPEKTGIIGDSIAQTKYSGEYDTGVSKLVYTGTGSCISTQYSNVIKNLRIETEQNSGVLIDTSKYTGIETNNLFENVSCKAPNKSNVRLFLLGNSDNQHATNNRLYYCGGQGGQYGFLIYTPDNYLFNCYADSNNYACFVSNRQNRFTECSFYNSYVTILQLFGSDLFFENCAFDNNGNFGNTCLTANNSSNVHFTNCRFLSGGIPIIAGTSQNYTFVNCFFDVPSVFSTDITLNNNYQYIGCYDNSPETLTNMGFFTNLQYTMQQIYKSTSGQTVSYYQNFDRTMFAQVGADSSAPDGTGYGIFVCFKTTSYKCELYCSSSGIWNNFYNGSSYSGWTKLE